MGTKGMYGKFDYFVMFIILFATDSFIVFANIDIVPKIIFRGMLVILLVYFAGKVRMAKLDRAGLFWMASLLLILASMIVNADFAMGSITKILVVTFGYILVRKWNFKKFKTIYSDWMIAISTVSLVGYVFREFICSTSIFPEVLNGGRPLTFFFLTNIDLGDGISIPRNWGPFWEPGVFQAYLLMTLLFIWRDRRRTDIQRMAVLAALITTFSTTGYLCLLILFFYFSAEKREPLKISKLGISLVFFVALGLIFGGSQIYGKVFEKLNRNSLLFESTRSRLESFGGNLFVMVNSPLAGLFGGGVTHIGDEFAVYMGEKGYTNFSNTNGLLMNFAAFGFLYGMLCVRMLYQFVKRNSEKRGSSLLLFCVLLGIMFAEPFVQSLFFNIIMFYGVDAYELRTNKEKEAAMAYKYNTVASMCRHGM